MKEAKTDDSKREPYPLYLPAFLDQKQRAIFTPCEHMFCTFPGVRKQVSQGVKTAPLFWSKRRRNTCFLLVPRDRVSNVLLPLFYFYSVNDNWMPSGQFKFWKWARKRRKPRSQHITKTLPLPSCYTRTSVSFSNTRVQEFNSPHTSSLAALLRGPEKKISPIDP